MMKRLGLLAVCALALLTPVGVRADDPSPQPFDATNPLYRRMVALNASLRTYKADVHLDVALKTFPFISPSLDGNAYYKQPDRQAVVFETVPALASAFKKVYPHIDAPGRWTALYDIGVFPSQGGETTFRLVPKKNGRVDHLDVKVDDATATVREYTWSYKDGGSVSFDQSFTQISGNYLVEKQTGRVDLPSYKADVSSNFHNYKLNVAVSDSVFAQ